MKERKFIKRRENDEYAFKEEIVWDMMSEIEERKWEEIDKMEWETEKSKDAWNTIFQEENSKSTPKDILWDSKRKFQRYSKGEFQGFSILFSEKMSHVFQKLEYCKEC